MEQREVRSIDVLSLCIVGAALGVVGGILFSTYNLFMGQASMHTLTIPFVLFSYGISITGGVIGGVLSTLASGVLYNLITNYVGGVVLRLDEA